MYHSSKRVLYSAAFVKGQQDAFLASVKYASRIYLIGLRVHAVDEHIWQPLAATKSALFYVGREPEDFHRWAGENLRKSAFSIANSFAEALQIIASHHGS